MNAINNQDVSQDVTVSQSAANLPVRSGSGIPAHAAWDIFLSSPVDQAFLAEHYDVLVDSINDPILDRQQTPLQALASFATGDQMARSASIFASAVDRYTMKPFSEGSLGMMALLAGNIEGALVAAQTCPDLHKVMRNKNNVTLLVQCMISGEMDLLRHLTARINDQPLIDPYFTDKAGYSTLASYFRKAPDPSLEVVQAFADCLLESRNLGDVSAAYYQRYFGLLDRYGKTCLHVLAQRLHDQKIPDESFTALFSWLSTQIDINHPDGDDETALITASHYNRPAVNKALLVDGALLDWVTHKGRTALTVAAYHGHTELIDLYMQYNQAAANVDPSIKKSDSDAERLRVPLLAARNKHWGALKHYLGFSTEGINQHDLSEDRHTPLIMAVKDMDPSAVSSLIKAGVDINAANNHGWTAVHYAAHHYSGNLRDRNNPSVRILFDLITHGGRLELADNKGITPLEVIVQRTDIESTDLFYAVNISLLSDWVFSGNRSLAEQYVDETHNLPFLTNSVLSNMHPLVGRAEKWRVENNGKVVATQDKKLRQAKTDLFTILVDCFNYSVATFGLISLEPFPPVKKAYDMIPPEWQWPVVGAVGVVMGLARATDYRGDMEKFQNIGYAAKSFASKIRAKVLTPALKLIRECTSSERGPLRHVVRYFSSMRKACLKIAMASQAFVHVLRRQSVVNSEPTEVANQLDPEMMKAIGEMSHQEFQKFKAQARSNARKNTQDQDMPAP